MDVSEVNLQARIAREVKRMLRQNREIPFSTQYLAERLVEQDPFIYREACLWGNSSIRHDRKGNQVIEPDLDLVETWVQGVFRTFKDKADKFSKWIRRHYYVTKYCKENGRYFLPYSPEPGLGRAGF
jgi:hypothetical protein